MFDRASVLAGSIADLGKQADALADLAGKAAGANPDRTLALFDRVETLLPAITDSDDGLLPSSVMAHLAAAMTRLDSAHAAVLVEQAERLTQAISNASWSMSTQADALAQLAVAVASADPDRAQALARSIADPERQADTLACLARRVAAVDMERARAVARSINIADRRARALANLDDTELARRAKAAARADPDQAEALAQKIADPDWRALVLANLARETTPARARRLIARAFRLSSWAIPLDALAQVEPATLTAIADDLLQSA